jgi:tetratricopeptide (TPR) repeat protein
MGQCISKRRGYEEDMAYATPYDNIVYVEQQLTSARMVSEERFAIPSMMSRSVSEVHILPDYFEHISEGLRLATQGKHSEAVERYNMSLAQSPDNPVAHYVLAYSLTCINIQREAVQRIQIEGTSRSSTLRTIDEDDPNFDGVNFEHPERSTTQTVGGSSDTEIRLTTRDTADRFCEDGLNLANANRHDEAILMYREAIKLVPNSAILYNNLAWSMHILGQDTDAFEVCEQSLSLDNRSGYAHDTKGCILRAQEKYPEALSEFEAALKCYNKVEAVEYKPLYLCNIGSVHQAQGNTWEAYKCFQKAQKLLKGQKIDLSGFDNHSKQFVEHAMAEYEQKKKLLDEITETAKVTDSVSKATSQASPPTSKHATMEATSTEMAPRSGVYNAVVMFKMQAARNEFKKFKDEMQCRVDNLYTAVDPELLILAKKQIAEITSNNKLDDYFKAFMFTFSQAYTSAQVVSGEGVSLDTQDLKSNLATKALSLIPFCGSVVSEVAGDVIDFVRSSQMIKKANKFTKLAYDAIDLHKKISPLAMSITLNEHKKSEILSDRIEVKNTGWFSKIVDKCKRIGGEVNEKLYGERYGSPSAKLGHEDACKLIDKWCTQDEVLRHNGQIITFFKYTLIEQEKWILTSTEDPKDSGITETTRAVEVVVVDHRNQADIIASEASQVVVLGLDTHGEYV